MNLLAPGVYVASGTTLHRLDPRVKLAAAMLLMVLPFTATSLASILLLSAFVLGAILLSAVPLLALVRTLRSVLWVGLFMFVFRSLTTPGQPLLTIGRMSLTWEGLLAGGMQVYRLCVVVMVPALLTYTTSPSQLAQGLEAVFRPADRLGLPVSEAAMVLTIALRFVPTLFEEVDTIVMAQESRGASIRSGPLWERGRGWVALFVPIFVSAFRRAQDLATAMEARGFRGARHRTHLHRLRLTRGDSVAGLAVLLLGVAIVVIEGCIF